MIDLDALVERLRGRVHSTPCLYSDAADAIKTLRAELATVLTDPDWRECCDLRRQAQNECKALRVELMHERELADAATLEIRELRAELAALRRELAHNCTRETEISNERHELRASLAAVEKDAERYRWLRESDDADVLLLDYNEDGSTDAWYQHHTEALDSEIDERLEAALAARGEK